MTDPFGYIWGGVSLGIKEDAKYKLEDINAKKISDGVYGLETLPWSQFVAAKKLGGPRTWSSRSK